MNLTKARFVLEACLLVLLAAVCGASGSWAWILLAIGCILVAATWWHRR